MAKFEIQAPDGQIYEVEGANDEQGALQALQTHLGRQQPAPAQQGEKWWESAPLVDQAKPDTLNIGGKRVKVDSSFMQLSPEQQNATVDEIAASIGVSQPGGQNGKNWWDDAPLVGPANSTAQQQTANQEWARQQADKIEAARQPGTFSDASDSILQGIPFGDEIVSGAMAPLRAGISAIKGDGFDIGREYNRSMDLEAELRRRREERSPIASTVGSVAGGLGVGGVAAKGGLSLLNNAKPTLLSMGGRGMTEGALWGAAYGAGEGRGAEDRLTNAIYGAGSGAAIGGLTGSLARIGAGKLDTSSLPTADDLKSTASAAYQRADDAGVVYSKSGMERLRDALVKDFTDFGYHPELQSGAKVALNEVNRLADGNVTLKGLDTARKIAGNAYQPGNKSNNALTAKVAGALDDFVANPQAGDILMGNGADAASAIKEARGLYGQARKLELVNSLFEKAGLRAGSSGSGANIENATRQELSKILKSDKMRRGFNKDELAAIKQAVMGTKTQNALRAVGKFAPSGVVSGGVGTSTGAFVGNLIGGPVGGAVGAIGLPAVGLGAKLAADAGSRGTARLVEALIASGGNLPRPQISAGKKAIIDALMRSGVQQLPAYTNR